MVTKFARGSAAIVGLVAALLCGVSAVIVGLFRTQESVRLILLDRQGKCDYLPCADNSTYLTAGVFGLVALAGAGLLAAVFILMLKGRSGNE